MLTNLNWQDIGTTLWMRALLTLPAASTGVAVFVLSWLLGIILQRILLRAGVTQRLDPDLCFLLGRVAKLTCLTIGGVTALGTLGIDVAALVTGLGLTGFALGIALKDIISNTLAGILLIVYKPFRQRDRISALTFSGTVLEVDLRYTVLEAENKRVFVPNALLLTNPITVEPRGA